MLSPKFRGSDARIWWGIGSKSTKGFFCGPMPLPVVDIGSRMYSSQWDIAEAVEWQIHEGVPKWMERVLSHFLRHVLLRTDVDTCT